MEEVSIAVRIRRSMTLSVPKGVDGQMGCLVDNGKTLTLETSLTSAEEVEERHPERT